MGNSIKDVICRTCKATYDSRISKVKQNAIKAGAYGVTISGAGPSVIAFSKNSMDLKKISNAMSKGFKTAHIECETIICKPSKGAIYVKNN